MVQWPKQREWGWYATLIRTPWFCVKVLRFKPEGVLSLQRHTYRTERWKFLKATGIIKYYLYKDTLKDDITINDYWGVWEIKKGWWHRFTALDKPVYAIELQYGRKVTESDIERK